MKFWIPVLLSALLGPGAGQLYNREFKKGVILLVLSLGVVAASTVWLGKALMPYVTQDVASMDVVQLAELGDRIRTNFNPSESAFLMLCYGALLILWLYGIIDAYQGAKRRKM